MSGAACRFVVLFALVAAALWTIGCAPSLSSMLENRHYGELVCMLDDQEDHPEIERADAKLLGELDPAVHVQVVTARELAEVVPEEVAKRALRALVLVSIRFDSRKTPLPAFEVQVRLRTAEGPLKNIYGSRERLVAYTKEVLPEEKSERRGVVLGSVEFLHPTGKAESASGQGANLDVFPGQPPELGVTS